MPLRDTSFNQPLALPTPNRAWLPASMLAALLLAWLSIAGVAWLTFRTLGNYEEASGWSRHTLEVMERLQSYQFGMRSAESSQRGYLITGVATYLDPYISAKAAQPARLSNLRALLADNQRQLARLDVLENLTNMRFEELESSVDMRRKGETVAAFSFVQSHQGKATMDRISEIVGAMVAEEQNLLQARQAQSVEARQQTQWAVMAGSTLLAALALALAVAGGRDHLRREAERWQRTIQSALAQRLQGERSSEALAERVLSFLAEAAGAQVGALYLRERQGTLRRIGVLGLNPADVPEVLDDHDGLLGRAVQEGRAMRLDGLPAGYFTVRSDRKSTRLNSSHSQQSRMPSSA